MPQIVRTRSLSAKADRAQTLDRLSKIRAERERRALSQSGVGSYMEFADMLRRHDAMQPMTLAQRVIAKVAFDKVQPSKLDAEELEMFHKLFGPDVHEIPEHAYPLYTSVCGIRSSKTYSASIRLLHLSLTVDLQPLAAGEDCFIIIVSTSLSNAQQAMKYIMGVVARVPALRAMVIGKMTPTKIRLRRGEHIISIEPRAAARAGVGGRGVSIAGILFDEAAMARGTEYQVSDEEIFVSLYSRLLPGGQMLMCSSPWVKSGILYDTWERDFNHPVVGMCVHAPTLLVLDTPRNRLLYEQTRRMDPDKADREYDARFVQNDAISFFSADMIEKSIDESLPVNGYRDPLPGDVTKGGADFGFISDSSSVVVVHNSAGLSLVGEICELRPASDEPLKPSEVIGKFAEIANRHSLGWLMSDAYNKASILEHLSDHGLALVAAPLDPADAYVACRILMTQGLIRIPRHPRFIAQLREIRAKRDTGGKVRMILPRTSGGHCDIVSAWVLAVWSACGQKMPDLIPDPNTEEGRAYLNVKLREERRVAKIKEASADSDSQSKWWKSSPDQRRSGFSSVISSTRSSRRDRFSRN